ncbi:hypothetical protein WN944_017241 [Citrus x changshan-huyou]|uniref:Uncharacterized protein n=1 Tax=Citrus x changshan-huyou TaxID=2935761 RepID=A0AAP0MD84_9ROSI
MALVVYWYDFICFGIVVAAYIGSLWILWRKESASRCDDNTIYESLLAAQADAMAVFLSWDILDWDASIFIYYTDNGKNTHLPNQERAKVKLCYYANRQLCDSHKEGLAYWLRWQVPVCALIILVPTSLTSCLIKKAKAKPLFLDDLWTPCWRKINPVWLLIYRAFSFLCLAFMFEAAVALDGAFAFYFYTQWTFTLVMVYFALGTVISAYGCWVYTKGHPSANGVRYEILKRDMEENIITNGMTYREKETKGNIKLQSHYVEEEIQQRAGFWGYLMQTVYQTCGGAVLLTDIVFWCVIVPFLSDAHLGLNTVSVHFSRTVSLIACMHTLNAVFLLLDTALNSLPFPWFRIAYFIQWSCLYCVFQWVIHACGFTWWPYPFLELDTPWAPLWYFVLAVVHIPCYGLYVLIVEAKNSILPTLFPRAFIRSY